MGRVSHQHYSIRGNALHGPGGGNSSRYHLEDPGLWHPSLHKALQEPERQARPGSGALQAYAHIGQGSALGKDPNIAARRQIVAEEELAVIGIDLSLRDQKLGADHYILRG